MHKLGKIWRRSVRRSVRAISPVVSAVVLIGAIVALIFVALTFANNFLTARLAESEFSVMKQFMHNVGLQIDDVAWITGRTQTLRYSSRYGHVSFIELALTYSIYLRNVSGGYEFFQSYTTGMLVFNMPTSKYSLGDNYFELLYPSSESFLFQGASAPVARVFVSEKIPMADGNFIRVAVVPCLRFLNSTIHDQSGDKNYFKFYLPTLSAGNSSKTSQTVTLTSRSISAYTRSDITGINITVSFPSSLEGFDPAFFGFSSFTESVTFPANSVFEIYVSTVDVSLGGHT